MVLTTKSFTFQHIPRKYGGKGHFSTNPVTRLLWLGQPQDFVGSFPKKKRKRKKQKRKMSLSWVMASSYSRIMTGYCQVYLPLNSELQTSCLLKMDLLHLVIPVNNISSNSLFLYHCTISMRIITRKQIKNIWDSFSFGQFWLKTENESKFLRRFFFVLFDLRKFNFLQWPTQALNLVFGRKNWYLEGAFWTFLSFFYKMNLVN